MFKTRKGLIAIAIIAAVAIGTGAWKFPEISQAVKLTGAPEISKEAQAHILHGDKRGGGHLYGTGKPCKTEFPKDWDEAEIIGNVRKVAANDNLKWKKQRNGYYTATDKVGDIRMKVVLDKEKDDVVTAYPVNGKPNTCKVHAKSARKQPVPAAKEEVTSSNTPNASNRAPKSYNFNTN